MELKQNCINKIEEIVNRIKPEEILIKGFEIDNSHKENPMRVIRYNKEVILININEYFTSRHCHNEEIFVGAAYVSQSDLEKINNLEERTEEIKKLKEKKQILSGIYNIRDAADEIMKKTDNYQKQNF